MQAMVVARAPTSILAKGSLRLRTLSTKYLVCSGVGSSSFMCILSAGAAGAAAGRAPRAPRPPPAPSPPTAPAPTHLGVEFHADTVHEKRRLGAVESHAVRAVFAAAHAVVAHAGRPSAQPMAVIHTGLVTEDEVRILKGRLLQIQNVAGAILVEPDSRGGNFQRRVHSHDLVHGVETMVSIIADESVGIVHERPVGEAGTVEGKECR